VVEERVEARAEAGLAVREAPPAPVPRHAAASQTVSLAKREPEAAVETPGAVRQTTHLQQTNGGASSLSKFLDNMSTIVFPEVRDLKKIENKQPRSKLRGIEEVASPWKSEISRPQNTFRNEASFGESDP
jgi:hypothetical protein